MIGKPGTTVPTADRECFVISPIGEDGSAERKRADDLLHALIRPTVLDHGFTRVHRADELGKPGMITRQIIDHIRSAQLVIADLADANPNVFYELAVRHATREPVVHLIAKGQEIPFDVAGFRTITYDRTLWGGLDKAKEELGRHIDAALAEPGKVDTPISTAIDLDALRQTGTEGEFKAQVLGELQDLRAEIRRLGGQGGGISRPRLLRTLKERFAVGELKEILRDLVTVQESHFADHTKYTDDISKLRQYGFSAPRDDIVVTVRLSSGAGWSAVAQSLNSVFPWGIWIGEPGAGMEHIDEGTPGSF